MRVRREAQKFGALGTQLQNFCNGRVVVMLVAVVATVHEHAPGLFAQITAIRVSKERVDGRAGVHDHPARLFLSYSRRSCRVTD